jgi:hypothetical protein
VAKKKSGKKSKRTGSKQAAPRKTKAPSTSDGPVTLEQATALVQARRLKRSARKAGAKSVSVDPASPGSVGAERMRLARQRRLEENQRIREYAALMAIMKRRGVKAAKSGKRRAAGRRPSAAKKAQVIRPLQIFAEGDSWFDYPVPFFGGGIIPRLQAKLGVPILNLAKAGDEVRYMLGVEQRKGLAKRLEDGCPAGGPWDVLLFSGGGNDIVDHPMALWVKEYRASVPPAMLLRQSRFESALALVRAGYEDLIELRDSLSPSTLLVFHCYDFAIPDGRGICHLGPWLKPTFELRKFPKRAPMVAVVNSMLEQFAAMLASLEQRKGVTFINGQGTLKHTTKSWHNELHPSKSGFKKFAQIFYKKLKAQFPDRVV